MNGENISITLDHFRPIEFNPIYSSLSEELATVLPELDLTSEFELKWNCCAMVCCPGLQLKCFNSDDTELCRLSCDPSSRYSCFCTCCGFFSSKQNIILSKTGNDKEILEVSYNPEVWLGTGRYQPRVVNIHLLGRTVPIGKIEYNSKCLNEINNPGSGKMINLSTDETFTFSQIEGNENSILILDSSDVPIAYAIVTKIMRYNGGQQAMQWTLRFSSNGNNMSSINKCLILGAVIVWIIGEKENTWKCFQMYFPICLIVCAIVFTVVFLLAKYEQTHKISEASGSNRTS